MPELPCAKPRRTRDCGEGQNRVAPRACARSSRSIAADDRLIDPPCRAGVLVHGQESEDGAGRAGHEIGGGARAQTSKVEEPGGVFGHLTCARIGVQVARRRSRPGPSNPARWSRPRRFPRCRGRSRSGRDRHWPPSAPSASRPRSGHQDVHAGAPRETAPRQAAPRRGRARESNPRATGHPSSCPSRQETRAGLPRRSTARRRASLAPADRAVRRSGRGSVA